jgi:7-cyano-7-deazaguanine synthase in queuosine biosynthesis
MASAHAVILQSGGLRSLVATAAILGEADRVRPLLLHVVDGRVAGAQRLEHVHRQAEYYGISRVIEMDCRHLYGHGLGFGSDGAPMGSVVGPQMMLAGLGLARLHQVERVVWAGSFNVDTRAMARATEQMMLCEHLASLEGAPLPRLEAPLLELTDQQVIELGAQLGVPWPLAWSCLMDGDRPCRVCGACRRRRAAFDGAGLVDPAEKLATAGR